MQARLEQDAAAATAHALDLERRSMECSAREGSVSHERADMEAREAAVTEREAAVAEREAAAAAAAAEVDAERAAAGSARAAAEQSQWQVDKLVEAHETRAAALEAAVGECTAARQQLREESARLDAQRQDLVAREGTVAQQLADVEHRVAAVDEENERVSSAKRDVEVWASLCACARSCHPPICCRVGLDARALWHRVLSTTQPMLPFFAFWPQVGGRGE
jgi:chromosome segregation ATPase